MYDAETSAIEDAVNNPSTSERSPEHRDTASSNHLGAWFGEEAQRAADDGYRTLDYYQEELSPQAGDRLDRLIREDDQRQFGARYLTAVGNPQYRSAFRKMLQHPQDATLRFTADEQTAVQNVNRIESLRALGVGTSGFPLPFTLDPTVLLSGTGVTSPIRQIARVETISTLTWHGIASDGITASFASEAAEASDNTPTLVQPVIQAQRAQAFVPFSFEAGQDWPTLEHELGRLFMDSKNTLEATKFLTGTGTNEPGGILNIGGTGGLTTSQRVQTANVATYAVGDPWLLKAALPPRFSLDSAYAAAPGTWDTTYRFVGGNSTEPYQFGGTSRLGDFLGLPKAEWSTMATGSTTGTKLMIAGYWPSYIICDRIGATMELIPHLFGAANRYPTGQRGAYFFWRVGGGTVVPNAFRYLEVK